MSVVGKYEIAIFVSIVALSIDFMPQVLFAVICVV